MDVLRSSFTINSILDDCYRSDCFQDVSISTASNPHQKTLLHSVILHQTLSWLTLESSVQEDRISVIMECEDSSLPYFVKLLYHGEVMSSDQTILNDLAMLCQRLGMSMSKVENVESTLTDDNDRLSNVSCDENEGEGQAPTKSSRRIFRANLTSDDLTCDICQRTFTAMYKLRIHRLVHSSTPPFVCSHCGRGFNNKYKMRSHEKRHYATDVEKEVKASWPYSERLDKRITCEKCGALFDTKKARKEHIQAAHPLYHAATHSCPLCQKVFRGLKGLNNHTANVDCQKSRRPRTQDDSKSTTVFQCDKCLVICSSRKSLKIHGKTAHLSEGEDALPFRCLTCNKSFLKQSYYEEHQNRFHVDIKPFPCMYCPKRCATKQDLDRHLISHRGETTFQCPFCSRSFVHRASLVKHQRSHLGERPYHCHACGKSYGLLSVLHKHHKFHERKGDKTRVITAPKGQRGSLSYIEFVDEETETTNTQTLVENSVGETSTAYPDNYATSADPVNVYREQEEAPTYHIMGMPTNDSIAMDILGLLEDQETNDKPLEETKIIGF